METTKPTKFHEKIKSGSLGGGFVSSECFVGFRDFGGFLDGEVNRDCAKVAKERKGRGCFGVSGGLDAVGSCGGWGRWVRMEFVFFYVDRIFHRTPLPLFLNDDPIFWQSGDRAAVSDGIESALWGGGAGGAAEVDPDESGGGAYGFGGATGEPTGGVEGEMGRLAFDPDQ